MPRPNLQRIAAIASIISVMGVLPLRSFAADAPVSAAQPENSQRTESPVATQQPIELQSAQKNTQANVQPVTSETLLPNGLRVVVLEDHTFPVVSCLTWYHVGSRNETPGSTGITHLLEHLLFGKVGSFRRGEIGSTIARVGGQFNGYTSDDFTTFFETLPPSKLELALKIESERMRGGAFSNADVQEEVANIQSEFENEHKDAGATLSRETRAALFQTHPYHNPTMGWRNDVETLNAEQVKNYYDKYFWPNNCTLVISGDVSSKNAVAAVNKYFAQIDKSPNSINVAKVQEPPQSGERRITVKYPGKQEAVEIAYHAPAFSDADAPPMVVLEKLLNSPISGRLKSKLIDAKVCNSASASFEAKKDPGMFTITCSSSGGTAGDQKVTDAVDALVAQLRSQPTSDLELRRAKNQAEFAFFTECEGPYRAGFHLGYFDSLSSWQSSATWAERLRAVTAADVQRVCKKYLNSDNRVVAFLAGASAPKAPASKPSSDSAPTQRSAPSKNLEHKLTGYKQDDEAIGPNRENSPRSGQLLIAAEPQQGYIIREATKESQQGEEDVVPKPKVLPAAVKEIPAAIGGAPRAIKELPAAVEAVPKVIKNIPNAIEGIPSAIKQIPSTLGSIPSAVKEIPGAITGIPGAAVSAVKNVPGAIGGLPGTAVTTVKELPGAIGEIPGAAVNAIMGVPSAIGNLAVGVGSIPGAIGKQLNPNAKADMPLRTVSRTLKNGVRLIIFETHLSPIVQVDGAVRAGSVYEPPTKRGLSPLTAALFNNGTARRSRWQLITQQEDLGIQPPYMVRFDAGTETIEVKTRCLSRDLQAQLDVIAETLSNPAVGDSDIDKARQDVQSELKQADDSVEKKASRLLRRNLLQSGSAFAPIDPAETNKILASVSTADERKFLNDTVVPSATTIVLSGDIDPERAVQIAEKSFATWEGKGVPQRVHAHPNPRRVLRASVPTKDRSKTTLSFGQLVPMAKQGPEFGSLLIADGVFSSHPLISRMNKRLSNEDAFAQALADESIDTKIDPMANAVEWSFTFSVEPNAVPVAVQSLQGELKQLSKTGVTPQEYTEVKRYLLGAIPVRSMSTIGSAAHALLESTIHGDESEGTWSTIGSVRAASLESVNRVIKTALRPEQCTMIVIGSPQSIRAARNQVATQNTESASPVSSEPLPQSAASAEKAQDDKK